MTFINMFFTGTWSVIFILPSFQISFDAENSSEDDTRDLTSRPASTHSSLYTSQSTTQGRDDEDYECCVW